MRDGFPPKQISFCRRTQCRSSCSRFGSIRFSTLIPEKAVSKFRHSSSRMPPTYGILISSSRTTVRTLKHSIRPRVERTEDNRRNAKIHYRTHAHCAGLKRNVKYAVVQAASAKFFCCCAERKQFCMRGCIAACFNKVVVRGI